MRTIQKYPIREDAFVHHFTVGAQILGVQVQNGIPTMWVELEAINPREPEQSLKTDEWAFTVVCTGGVVPDNARHIATYQVPPYVWHLYQMIGGESG